MPEGPSLVYIKEQLEPFVGRKITAAGGYSPMPTDWLVNKKLLEVQTWGKHLLLRFTNGTVRIHLMLFGSLTINKKKKVNASVWLQFGKEELNFYVVQAKKISEPLEEIYDWRTDIMSEKWNARHVRKLLAEYSTKWIGDVLLDQEVFTGVGNIIRNEVLYRSKIHPLALVNDIPPPAITVLLRQVRSYGKAFLREKKRGTLSANWQAHEKEICQRDDIPLKKKKIGKTKRPAYYCNNCQDRFHK